MVFSTYDFIFIFLPLVVAVFLLVSQTISHRFAIFWLVLCSLVFYGWWNPKYLVILLGSIIANYFVGIWLQENRNRSLLSAAITANLAVLGWFKYSIFILDNVNALSGSSFFIDKVVLPIGISFFTFQQVAWLVDSHRGQVKDRDPLSYALFVAFFPQLIAGPIVHHSEVIHQYIKRRPRNRILDDLGIGCSIFIIGLAKKVLIADRLAPFSDFMFNTAAAGATIGLAGAWLGVLAYSLQIYFDFSAYSDMTIGIAAMMGFRLPLNFNAPYKATNIREFWRRWHMTLSRFLRDYLYFPLGGNRKGRVLQVRNLFITMLLGGLWHGASWNFVLWGGLHGLFLAVHQYWCQILKRIGKPALMPRWLSIFLTCLVVVLAWVPFRADDLSVTAEIFRQLFGLGGIFAPVWITDPIIYGVPETIVLGKLQALGLSALSSAMSLQGLLVATGFFIAWVMPSTAQLFEHWFYPYGVESYPDRTPLFPFRWRPGIAWLVAIGLLYLACVVFMRRQAPFLYFQF